MNRILFLVFLLTATTAFAAANSHSTDLETSSAQYWSDTTTTNIAGTGDFTLDAMIKLEQLPSTASKIFGIISSGGAGGAGPYPFSLRIVNDNKIYCAFADSGGNFSQVITNAALGADDIGRWQRITCTADVSAAGSGITIYIDGVATSSTIANDTGSSRVSTNDDVYVGLDTWGTSREFDGLLDEVAFYDAVVTPAAVCDRATSDANLVSWWKFDNDATDETANANDLTGTNSPTFSTDIDDACAAPVGESLIPRTWIQNGAIHIDNGALIIQ